MENIEPNTLLGGDISFNDDIGTFPNFRPSSDVQIVKILFITLLFAVTANAAEPNAEWKYDPNSPAAIAAKEQYELYERDGQVLDTSKLYEEIRRLNTAKEARITAVLIAKNNPVDAWAESIKITDDDMRKMSYEKILRIRSDKGEPVASFYYAVNQWDFCIQMQNSKNTAEAWAQHTKECWQRVIPALKRASESQIAAASFNIGRLYENGFGVLPSKLVAAEWYVKSADQYNKEKNRDEALTSLESALNLVPDHPTAIRLRKAMLK